jgi:hypothetical protein
VAADIAAELEPFYGREAEMDPPLTRESAFSRAASLKLANSRVGLAASADVKLNVNFSWSRPKACASTVAAAARPTGAAVVAEDVGYDGADASAPSSIVA